MTSDTLIKNTVVPATITASGLVLASRIPFSAESLVGFSTVLLIGAIAALEYRILGKN